MNGFALGCAYRYLLAHALREDLRADHPCREGPLPAAGPQRVGSGSAAVAHAGAVQLRPRGRLDKDAVRRLVASLSRLLDPAEALAAAEPGDLSVTGSRPLGGTHALDQMWRRLRLDQVIGRALADRAGAGRRPNPETERVLFALVANRALAASSKLAAAEWVREDVHIDGLDETSDDACYRAMDQLLAIGPDLAQQAYYQVTDLLNLEVDLLFFDTASTYFETEEADGDVPRDEDGKRVAPGSGEAASEDGFRTWGKSKDSRDDLPQVIVGMAVTRSGIPVRVWSWPGNTADSGLIRQVKKDLREWVLSKVVWVADRGFTSKENRRALMRGGGGYIVGEKLRSGSAEAKAVMSRQGRYKTVKDNLQVKEVRLGDDSDRFIICHNPDQAGRDAAVRARLLAQLEELIKDTDSLPASERAKLEKVPWPASPAWNGSCASPPPACSASTRPGSRPRRTSTASTSCAPATRTCPPRTSPWDTSSSWKSSAAGAT